ncbi:MAG: S41 family peptidase [Proteobacteria bacterium]|nr:S41 family peptidase [Pseudomonadota bacterium]
MLNKLPRGLIFGLLAVMATGCGIAQRSPGPEARAAADQLAAQTGSVALPARSEFALFAKVFDQVRAFYVDPVDDAALLKAAANGMRTSYPEPGKVPDAELVDAAINGMLSSLDSYSAYLGEEAYSALQEQTRGQFGGIGLQVGLENELLKVISPIDGTPAAEAGMLSGDLITHADGFALRGLTLNDAVLRLRGEVGSQVKLTVQRGGSATFDVAITRAVIQIHPVRWTLENNIGYVRISTFNARASGEFAAAVRDIRAQAGGALTGFVIDLRNNPGGLFEQAVFISDVLLEQGQIVSTRGRAFQQSHAALPGDITGGLPIAVLINGGSASAAEILAGALRDNHRAVLVGEKSYGKGSVQTIIPFPNQDGLRLTTARYYTPSGRTVEGGIEPDITVANDNNSAVDLQRDRAAAELKRVARR